MQQQFLTKNMRSSTIGARHKRKSNGGNRKSMLGSQGMSNYDASDVISETTSYRPQQRNTGVMSTQTVNKCKNKKKKYINQY